MTGKPTIRTWQAGTKWFARLGIFASQGKTQDEAVTNVLNTASTTGWSKDKDDYNIKVVEPPKT
jgi:hypothetical protein